MLNFAVVEELLFLAEKCFPLNSEHIHFAKHYVRAKGSLHLLAFDRNDSTRPDTLAVREIALTGLKEITTYDGLWHARESGGKTPSTLHLAMICYGYSPVPDDLSQWTSSDVRCRLAPFLD
jgi:hypothetical protein